MNSFFSSENLMFFKLDLFLIEPIRSASQQDESEERNESFCRLLSRWFFFFFLIVIVVLSEWDDKI